MELGLLEELTKVFALSVLVLVACHRLHIPAIAGLLATGVASGPYGLQLISSKHEVEVMAEIGVVLLLFTIGTEFSLRGLLQIRRLVLIAGPVQSGLTFAGTYCLALLFGAGHGAAIVLGFLASLSSTALVLKILADRAEIDTVHGRTVFGVLIFQDLVVVPAMLVIPHLGPGAVVAGESLWAVTGKVVAIVLGLGIAAKWLVPRILDLVAGTKNRELFLLTIVVICFSVAFVTQGAGLSLSLGALLAGLVVSESEYSHQALANVLPFQQVFTTLFFVSVGMLLDVSFLFDNFWMLLAVTALIVVGKSVLAIPAALSVGFSFRSAILSGLALAQIGEFSFILAKEALRYDVLSPSLYQAFLSVSVLTIASTPFVIAAGPRLAHYLLAMPWPSWLTSGWARAGHQGLPATDRREGHLVIIGFGLNGEAVAQSAAAANIPYVAIEMNPALIKEARAKGLHVVYGDATQEAVLVKEGVATARVVFVGISDPIGAQHVVATVKSLNPQAYVIVRTRLVRNIPILYRRKADEVIAEEFETAIESLCRVLKRFLIPADEIDNCSSAFRARGYRMFRKLDSHSPHINDLKLHAPQVDLFTCRVHGNSQHLDKSLADVALRASYGVTLLAIKRGAEVIVNPSGATILKAGDLLVLLGPPTDPAALALSFRQ